MLPMSWKEKYEVVIGLEVHAQLATLSKLFCGDSTSFGAEPNTQVSPITLGHPGTLPKTNNLHVQILPAHVIEYSIHVRCVNGRFELFEREYRYDNSHV